MLINQNCKNEECQKEYMADTREINRGNGMYCGLKCSGRAISIRKAREKEAAGFDAFCPVCNKGIYLNARRRRNNKSGIYFCSRKHQAIGFKDPNIDVTPGPTESPNKRKCDNCNKRIRSKVNSLCRECLKQDRINKWLSGDLSVTYSGTVKEPKRFVKEYLIQTNGDKCEECGFDKKRPDGTSKMQMDHIDGNYLNNLIDNLRLLCPNCHDDTETYGSRNKNGGRRYRLAIALNRTI